MNKTEILEKAYELGFKGEHDVRGCAQCALHRH